MTNQEYVSLHGKVSAVRRNWVRAAVLGANDGIVSVAGLVVGVASAANSHGIIFAAGTAGIVAGALSMAAGEYVSVSSQRDSEKTLVREERQELQTNPDDELRELASFYRAKGVSPATAKTVAQELTAHDALTAHVEIEHGIDPTQLTSAWNAAFASALSFTAGASIPLLSILLAPDSARISITFTSVLIALAITGVLSAKAGGIDPVRATARVMVGGALAMAITFAIGKLFGITV